MFLCPLIGLSPLAPASLEVPTATAGTSSLRTLAVLALLGAVLATAFVVTKDSTHHYKVRFDDAGQLVRGDLVRIGGSQAGTVKEVGLADNGQAEISISLEDEYGPLHDGTTVVIRSPGLASTASRYLDISPAPNFEPELADDAVIDSIHTQAIVEVDQLFNALDADTRKGLQQVISGFSDWYEGKERQANQSARYFPPALQAVSKLFSEIDSDSAMFQRFLVDAGVALNAATEREGQLTELVSQTRATMAALGSDTASLGDAIEQLPPALAKGSEAFEALDPALDDLQALVEASGPATKDLEPFMRQLSPVLDRATPTFRQLRLMFDRAGENNDLYEALLELPELGRLVKDGFPRARRALTDSTPVFSFARPYIPDLVSWTSGFGSALATYDANGHYARTVPVFDAFRFVDDADGGRLEPTPSSARGPSGDLISGQLRRCPGAAGTSPDGSGPFVDDGPLANPDCDPSQVAGR